MDNQMSFIEKQFPVSKVSKESYKERRSGATQTLTKYGKWWGRKPLILVRAAILGCLMPCSNNLRADMDIFLKILSMDNDGLLDRKQKSISAKQLYEIAQTNKHFKQYITDWFDPDGSKLKIRDGIVKNDIEIRLFKTLGYDEKLKYCIRPEQLPNLRNDSWNAINHHLGTQAKSFNELVEQLSMKRYGRNIVVGDCFCGGGSIPFEAARMGFDSHASDLNPIAGLLTWSGINFNNLSEQECSALNNFQRDVFQKAQSEIESLGIESGLADSKDFSYLYCLEASCPECGIKVPLAPSWVIGKGTKTIAVLHQEDRYYKINVKMNASPNEIKEAEKGTFTSKGLLCPHCQKTTPLAILRGDRTDTNGNTVYGLRQWEKSEFDFRDSDVFNERLYAIKYETPDGKRYYRTPNERDLINELKAKQLVEENIVNWQEQGLVPNMAIESGFNTDQVIRERGWTHWNHLFNARQLLYLSTLQKIALSSATNPKEYVISILNINKCLNFNSRLCRWRTSGDAEHNTDTFYNQALNTLMNYGARPIYDLKETFFTNLLPSTDNTKTTKIQITDARDNLGYCDYWVTDPPYADAVNYHELSEFFLAWDKTLMQAAFPEWYTDSKRILAVRGDEHFSQTMIEIYSNLANHMSDDGMQIVMFTHSDPAVWAQLALIMWKSGLRVTAAWNIATETDASGLKNGNYVKGTVLLVLRKQTGDDMAFLDEINSDIRAEVRTQISSMLELDNKEEPNFSDPDFVLAAYAASLKVLTSYKTIEDLDLDYELNLAINNPSQSSIVKIIETAKKIAYDCVIPLEFESYLWKDLTNAEKFYIKGLESEKHGNYQISTYQEFARGFSIGGYSQMMASEKANSARLKTPVEMASRTINEVPDFENSLLRTIFLGIYTGIKEDENPTKALGYIKNEMPNYWDKRDMIKQLLQFIKDTEDIDNMTPYWDQSAKMADLLHSLVTHDSI